MGGFPLSQKPIKGQPFSLAFLWSQSRLVACLRLHIQVVSTSTGDAKLECSSTLLLVQITGAAHCPFPANCQLSVCLTFEGQSTRYQKGTHKLSVLKNRIDSKGKVRSIGLYQIPMCAHAEGALHDFAGGILTDDQYFRAWTELSN